MVSSLPTSILAIVIAITIALTSWWVQITIGTWSSVMLFINGATAVSSKLCWLFSGWSKQPQSDSSTFSNLVLAGERLNNSNVTSDRDDLTKRFGEVESIGIESIESEIPSKESDFVRSIQFTGTRYEVSLPWTDNRPHIEDDYELCQNRLRSLHQKLLKNPKHPEEYNRNIEEQLATGIVEEVPQSNND